MDNHETSVVCPTCFETFTIAGPDVSELPAEWDYDCEVCCRPMIVHFYEEDGEVFGDAQSLED